MSKHQNIQNEPKSGLLFQKPEDKIPKSRSQFLKRGLRALEDNLNAFMRQQDSFGDFSVSNNCLKSNDCKTPFKLLLAVSGGPDSMALLDMATSWCLQKGLNLPMSLGVAHVNYHKRDTAIRDQKIVEDWCAKFQIPFYLLDAGEPEGNFQDWARVIRYDFFAKIMKEHGYQALLCAHQADDAIETWMMQKQRGSIPQTYGLAPVSQMKDICILRPLLSFYKQELEDYCNERGISYGIDESNLEDDYTRNQIRHHIIEQADIEQKEAWLDEIDRDQKQLESKRKEADAFLQAHAPFDILNHPDAPFVMEYWIYQNTGMHLSRKRIVQLLKDLEADHVIEVDDWNLERYHGALFLEKKYEKMKEIRFFNENSLQKFLEQPFGNPEKPYILSNSGQKIESFCTLPDDFPLTIRNIHAKDKIRLKYGSKKVSRALMDRHLPRLVREKIPVIANRKNEVIFVPYIGCDITHFSCKSCLFMIELSSYIERRKQNIASSDM